MKLLLRNLEIILSVAGVLVVLAAVVLISPYGFNPWAVGAVTAIAVGLIHGVIFWLVRRRQRQARIDAFDEIQQMLKDMINNQLTVIQTMSNLRDVRPEETARACDYITRSVSNISSVLHELSEESLRRWQRQYHKRASIPSPPKR
jgi:hypothetical protein